MIKMSFYIHDHFVYKIGSFIERPNRFVAFVKLNNKIVRCHVPDPGRLKELLIPDRKVLLRIPKDKTNYKTFAAVIGVQLPDEKWVSLDSQLANRLIRHEWRNLPVIKEYNSMKPEYSLNKESRIDFYFSSLKKSRSCLVEVKTVTLHHPENSGIGKFPDAPTKRGSRHLEELIHAHNQGYRTIVLFVSPRGDINEIRPNNLTDPVFTSNLFRASEMGVELLGFRCKFNTNGIKFDTEIPVNLKL